MKLKFLAILFLCALGFSAFAQRTTKTYNLRVSNSIQYTGGTPGANKVLVSDADGNATWGAITDSSNIWQSSDGNVSLVDSTDRVGLGTSTPDSAFTVVGGVSVTGNSTQTGVASVTGNTQLIDGFDYFFESGNTDPDDNGNMRQGMLDIGGRIFFVKQIRRNDNWETYSTEGF